MAATKKRRRRRKRKGHYHTGIHLSTKTGQACKYRSGWELVYMQWLDAHAAVSSYTYERTKIPYVSNVRTGKLRNYLPDFLVEFNDGSRSLVEIKPKRKVAHVTVQKKLKAAAEWCRLNSVTLQVITEVELRVLGLLK